MKPVPSEITPPGQRPLWADEPHCVRAGRFLLGRELGRGGMGRVLEAWDPVLKRMVALKLLYSRDPQHLVRVLREAQNQARLDHPHVCRVLEVEAEAEQPFIAMALIHGKPLGDLRPQLDSTAIARILADVAGAIHAAHKAGIVHRDLKPQNILVEVRAEQGWMPFVVDFGLARDLSLDDQTLSWAMVGTPAFMSPQQAHGAPARPSDDIYSLGATLYALLGGAPPHEATTLVGLISQQTRRDPLPLRRRLPQIPKDLETIAARCLETEPLSRYASAFELESDLRRFLAGEPIQARPVSLAGKAWRRVKRHRTLALTIAASALVVLALLGWNLRTRTLGRRQVEVAQRFGMEVKEIESLLRIERMLPVHDMRPVEGQVRARLARLRQSMAALGPSAEGPGQYALGRGLLSVRDYTKALEALERAWDVGYRPPEVAATLAQVHLAMGERDRSLGAGKPGGSPGAQDSPEPWRVHWDKALLFFRLTEGQGVESATFAKAQVAFLEKRMAECIALSEQAIQEQPWRYEALLLAGQAAVDQARDGSSLEGQRLDTLRPVYHAAEATLERAAAMARSDVDVYRHLLMAIKAGSILESEGGAPSLEPLVRARQLFEIALKIQPDDSTMVEWQRTLAREIFIRLAAGEDTRDICRDCIEKGKEVAHAAPKGLGALSEFDSVSYWLLGESQWRRGENPRAALEASLSANSRATYNQAEALNVLARYEGQHGRDIHDRIQRAEQILADEVRMAPQYIYMHTLWGECLTVQSHWEFWTGRNPLEAIRRGKAQLDEAIRRQPGSVYSYFHLPLLHGMEARLLMAQGKDPARSVAAAIRVAHAGAGIRANHYRTQLALIEAHHVAALAAVQAHRNPVAQIAWAHQAVRDAWALNGTDWRIALAESRLVLTEAEVAHAGGQSPAAHLARADRSADKGLRVKADAPELLLCRAEAARLQARWEGDAHAEALALAFTRKAHELCPDMALPR